MRLITLLAAIPAIATLCVAPASARDLRDFVPQDAPNCAVTAPPADAGFAMGPGGNAFLVHPRNAGIAAGYTGCKMLWAAQGETKTVRFVSLYFKQGKLAVAVAHEAGGPQVLFEQVVERPGHHVAVGARRVLRDAAHVDDELLDGALRRDVTAHQVRDSRREAGVGHEGDVRGARVGVEGERVFGAEAHVDEGAPRLDRRAHHRETQARWERAHAEVMRGHAGGEARRVGEVHLGPGEVGQGGKPGRAQVADGDARVGERAGEVCGDHAALLAASEHENVHDGRGVYAVSAGLGEGSVRPSLRCQEGEC